MSQQTVKRQPMAAIINLLKHTLKGSQKSRDRTATDRAQGEMATDYFVAKRPSKVDGQAASPASPNTPPTPLRSNALSSKVNSVLSASYADLEIRDALHLLDERGIENTAETRRQLRLDIQRDVIESNGLVIREFGDVAEVRCILLRCSATVTDALPIATQTHWADYCESEPGMRGDATAHHRRAPGDGASAG